MINAVNTINNNTKLTMASPLAVYKQAQNLTAVLSSLVYQSISILSGGDENGVTRQQLTDFITVLENENLSKTNAYKLVNTMVDKFDVLSSNGKTITEADFLAVMKFSVAQSFSQSGLLNSLIKDGSLSISGSLLSQFGADNANTLALMSFLDELSEDTVAKVAYGMKNAKARASADHRIYASSDFQDYTTVTKQQVTLPINIAV